MTCMDMLNLSESTVVVSLKAGIVNGFSGLGLPWIPFYRPAIKRHDVDSYTMLFCGRCVDFQSSRCVILPLLQVQYSNSITASSNSTTAGSNSATAGSNSTTAGSNSTTAGKTLRQQVVSTLLQVVTALLPEVTTLLQVVTALLQVVTALLQVVTTLLQV